MERLQVDSVVLASGSVAPPSPVDDRASAGPAGDPFLGRAGPDVVIGRPPALVRVYAVFRIDPQTRSVRCEVVDENGRILRMIPPATVTEMITAMAGYARR
jgi:hypothetical protein